MNESDKIKVEEVVVRAAVARAFEMSGSGYAKNQVTLFLGSLVNDGFYVCRSQQSKVEQRADNSESKPCCQAVRLLNKVNSTTWRCPVCYAEV